jgi:hypothetical protein
VLNLNLNFDISCFLFLVVNHLTTIEVLVIVDPNFVLHISSSWVQRSLHTEFQLHCMSRSGRFMVGDKKKQQHFHRINGFLSLQFELRLERGLRLRLTNNRQFENQI